MSYKKTKGMSARKKPPVKDLGPLTKHLPGEWQMFRTKIISVKKVLPNDITNE
jgi:hypothetical protein